MGVTGVTARAADTTPQAYVQPLFERDLGADVVAGVPAQGSGTVWEDGLLVYGAGTILPVGSLDDALRRSRDERSLFFDSLVLHAGFYRFDARHQ